MSKTKFRIVAFSLLFVGLGVMIGSLFTPEERTKRLLLCVTGAFYLAAAVWIVNYKRRTN